MCGSGRPTFHSPKSSWMNAWNSASSPETLRARRAAHLARDRAAERDAPALLAAVAVLRRELLLQVVLGREVGADDGDGEREHEDAADHRAHAEALADERLPAKGPGLAGNGNFVLSSVRIFAKPADDTNSGRGKRYPIAAARADFSQGGRQVSSVPGDNPTDGWAVYPKVGKSHFAVFELHEPIQRAKNDGDTTLLTIELDHQVHHDHNLGRFRLSVATAPQPVPDDLPNSALVDIRASPAGQRTGSDVLRLVRFFD